LSTSPRASPSEIAAQVAQFCAAPGGAVQWDGEGKTLRDRFSGKTLALDPAQIQELVLRPAADASERYLLIVREDGRQLALARAGIAFPPDLRNAGALPGMPQVVCFRDFASVIGQVEHVLGAHPAEPPGRELLDLVRYCIALLDGARAAGFEVGEEERRLERDLAEIERRSGQR
jgi:hypothetical protein